MHAMKPKSNESSATESRLRMKAPQLPANDRVEARKRPRKRPVRGSATDTVRAMLEATGLVLTHWGLARVTTVRIATTAGVSVGSLYQYYPGKEALIAAWEETQWSLLEEDVTRLVTESHALPPAELTLAFVKRLAPVARAYASVLGNAPLFARREIVAQAIERTAGQVAAACFGAEPDTARRLARARRAVIAVTSACLTVGCVGDMSDFALELAPVFTMTVVCT